VRQFAAFTQHNQQDIVAIRQLCMPDRSGKTLDVPLAIKQLAGSLELLNNTYGETP